MWNIWGEIKLQLFFLYLIGLHLQFSVLVLRFDERIGVEAVDLLHGGANQLSRGHQSGDSTIVRTSSCQSPALVASFASVCVDPS